MDELTDSAGALIRQRLNESIDSKRRVLESECIDVAAKAALAIAQSIERGGKVIFFGNGGSAMDAGHLSAELLGRYYIDRPSLPSLALSDLTAAVTAIGNDYAYDEIFVRPLRGLGNSGDVAVGLTTSGNSTNVVLALEAAKDVGMISVALTGASGGKVGAVADYCVCVPETDTPRVQEACMQLGHTMCEIVESHFFGPGVRDA